MSNQHDISIFEYKDFREFLQDFYTQKKEFDRKFSHRYFSQKMGVKSPGYFSDIIKGRVNLTLNKIKLCANLLELSLDESIFFEDLVQFNQAQTSEEKELFGKKVLNHKQLQIQRLDADYFEYMSHWYNVAIRELLFYFPLKDNFRDLATQLSPAISEQEAKDSIALQEKLGLIEKIDGQYRQCSETLSTGNEIRQSNTMIDQCKLSMIDLAKNALENTPTTKRDISALTLSLSESGFQKIKSIIQRTRKEILAEAQKDEDENKVYQINLQLFPLTKDYKP